MALSEKELLQLSVIEKKKIRKALFSYCDKYGIRCKSRKTFIDATMSLFEKGLEDTLNKLQKKRIEEYNPEHLIPLYPHAPVAVDANRIYCPTCRDYVDKPKNKFIFSTHRTGKRQIKHSQHCDECDYEIQYSLRLFQDNAVDNNNEEQMEKERLTLCGEQWTEE